MGGIAIQPVETKADRKRFTDLPFRLYRSDPNWRESLKMEVRDLI